MKRRVLGGFVLPLLLALFTSLVVFQTVRSHARDLERVTRAGRAESDLNALIKAVVDAQTGRPQPLPPELAQVAYRVLQEMVTNGLRHGRRDAPVQVDRIWDDGLCLRVANGTDGAAPSPGGRGLVGMRHRLASVGGRLDVEPGPHRFAVTARLPVRR